MASIAGSIPNDTNRFLIARMDNPTRKKMNNNFFFSNIQLISLDLISNETANSQAVDYDDEQLDTFSSHMERPIESQICSALT